MKKITLLLAMIFIAGNLFSQTLNQTTTWPDATWTITGTYNPANLLQNPTTTDTKFQFDDAQVSNVGDEIYLEAPAIDLSAAFTANEKALKISITIAFSLTVFTSEAIGFQYWDADASTWILMPEGSPGSGESAGDYTTCATGPQDIYFDFKDFTANQQQNFKYRMFYNDGGLATGNGVCMNAPTVISVDVSCSAPTALHTTLVGFDSVTIGWTANSSETHWQIEYGIAGFALGFGVQQDADVNPQGIPDGSHTINPDTSYDFYVRANCIPDMAGGAVYSSWSTKLNFTTTSVPCTQPSGGLANQLKPDSANLTWSPQGSESAWTVEYGPVGYTIGSAQTLASFNTTSSTTNTISGLSESTSYDFYVMADCGGGNTSALAGPYNFTTTAYTIGWLNVQWPTSGSIVVGDAFTVFAQVFVGGLTEAPGQGAGINAWIGFNTANTHPSTWPSSSWVAATYNVDVGNNDEYKADIGSVITIAGTYYYASRFQTSNGIDNFGGVGGVYDGISNVSAVLTVTGTLGVGDDKIEGFSFYPNPIKDRLVLSAKQSINQVEVYNLLGQVLMVTLPNLNNYEMQLSSLKTGIYFLKVTVADKIGTYKIVKQ